MDVDFKDVTEEEKAAERASKEEIKNLPALLGAGSTLVNRIHNNTEAMERLAHEAELDKKLGLNTQTRLTFADALHKELSDIASEYPEVDNAGLEKLFGINPLMLKIKFHNFIQIMKPIAFLSAMLTIAIVMFHLMPIIIRGAGISPDAISPEWRDWVEVVGTIILGFWTLIGICRMMPVKDNDTWQCIPQSWNIRLYDLSLRAEDISNTSMKIIYGAKLRLAEAVDKGLFQSFSIYYPEVTKREFILKVPQTDPAIVGNVNINGRKRMFLISCWDIEKDRDRVINDFKKMKKLKVN